MSIETELTMQEIPIVGVRDPRTVVGGRKYAILKGPKLDTFTPFTTTNVSPSNITYSVKTPSVNVFVNKCLYHILPIRIQLNSSAPNAFNLLRAGFDSPRSYMIAQSLNNLSTSFNGQNINVPLGDYMSALIRYNTPESIKQTAYSMTPSYLDQSQNYHDLEGTIKNPLSFYGDGYGSQTGGRASFPFNIVSNTPSQAVIDILACEPIFVSPYYFGKTSDTLGGPSFIGIQNLDFQFNFYANAWARMWSHDGVGGINPPGPITSGQVAFSSFNSLNINAFSYSITTPQLLFEYLTPSEIQIIPKSISYPYYRVQRFPTEQPALARNTSYQVNAQNIQLQSIPRRMYIYCRLNNQTLQNSCSWTDTFTSIEKLSITWNNNANLLSSCTKQDLYNISVRNHCKDNWSSWSGEHIYKTGSFTEKIAGAGSVVALNFGTDIQLNSASEAPGLLGSFNLQVSATVNWTNTDVNITSQNFTLYVVTCEEGLCEIQNGQVNIQTGVLSQKDILDSMNAPDMDYSDLMHVGGGNFLSGIRKFGENIYNKLSHAWNKYGKYVAPVVEQFLPATKPLFALADQYLTKKEQEEAIKTAIDDKKGEGLVMSRRGGALVGGRLAKRKVLTDRLY